jgi:sulfur-carrier protein
MIVHVKLFAAARDRAQSPEVEVHVTGPATVAAVRAALAEQYPALTPILRAALFAINADYGSDATVIPPDAEVACIPPVSGG